MKNILVTGAAGFILSCYVNYIAKKYPDYNFIVLDKLDYCASLDNLDKNPNVDVVIGDIANKELVTYILNKFDIDTIVHGAASSHVDHSFFNSVQFTINNTLGTHYLLEAVRLYHEKTGKIQRFHHVSTDEVFGSCDDENPKTELSLLAATNPYASSKQAAESVVMSYYYSYKMPVIITRSSNIFGINQYPEKIIPRFICNLLNGQKLPIHGQGTSRRLFLHVDDVCTAFETILFSGEIGHVYNISADHSNEYTVIEIAKKLIKLFHSSVNVDDPTQLNQYLEYVDDRKFNDQRYFISSEKLHKLGWRPVKTNFDENLKELIEWYRVNKSRYGF